MKKAKELRDEETGRADAAEVVRQQRSPENKNKTKYEIHIRADVTLTISLPILIRQYH
jgi:hypothetical protein